MQTSESIWFLICSALSCFIMDENLQRKFKKLLLLLTILIAGCASDENTLNIYEMLCQFGENTATGSINSTVYAVYPSTQTVIKYMTLQEKLNNCVVFNTLNWSCIHPLEGKIKVVNGLVDPTYRRLNYLLFVSLSQWESIKKSFWNQKKLDEECNSYREKWSKLPQFP